jgi:hypothetical protein
MIEGDSYKMEKRKAVQPVRAGIPKSKVWGLGDRWKRECPRKLRYIGMILRAP